MVKEAEMTRRAAGEQQEWFDDLRAQFSDLHRRFEDKCIFLLISLCVRWIWIAKQEEEAKKRMRDWEKAVEQKNLELEEERGKWEAKLKKASLDKDAGIQTQCIIN